MPWWAWLLLGWVLCAVPIALVVGVTIDQLTD